MSTRVATRARPGGVFAPACAGPTPDRRSFVVLAGMPLGADYENGALRAEVEEVCAAELVSSAVGEDVGRHAPVLDVDVPATLTLSPSGGFVLWVSGLDRAQWQGCAAALAAAGLGGDLAGLDAQAGFSVADASAGRRRLLAGSAGWERAEFGELTGLLRVLGPGWAGSFSELVEASCAAVMTGAPRGVRTTTRDAGLTDPWPLPLSVPALLLPSTHHHHLYVETVVDEQVMFTLLDRLAVCGLLERGFVSASRDRGRAYLRLPWVSKDIELGRVT